jgi:MOSC domain-containing protein YiiM
MSEIVLLLASPIHRYDGRPNDGALPFDGIEVHESIKVREGLGIVGDRFFAQRAHRHEAVTIIAAESIDAVGDDLEYAKTRRNIVTRGIEIDQMRGAVFSLDTGSGPVWFRAHRPANPCVWMDVELADGAFAGLRGRGGMRCEALSDGTLTRGPVELRDDPHLGGARAPH